MSFSQDEGDISSLIERGAVGISVNDHFNRRTENRDLQLFNAQNDRKNLMKRKPRSSVSSIGKAFWQMV